jgi:hypothetical protein
MEQNRKARDASSSAGGTMADNDVADRFGGDAPVFGQDLDVPMKPDPGVVSGDNPIADRFTN